MTLSEAGVNYIGVWNDPYERTAMAMAEAIMIRQQQSNWQACNRIWHESMH